MARNEQFTNLGAEEALIMPLAGYQLLAFFIAFEALQSSAGVHES
jgi:hypothetical protein